MNKLAFIIMMLLLLTPLTGCVSLPQPSEQVQYSAKLESFYRQWQATNYRFGGQDRNGIDCSALVVRAYKDLFRLRLPRTTVEQAKLGQKVSKTSLQPGDLVFFKTGLKQRHVGIYVGNSSFVHAGVKNGVTKSSLHSSYWTKRYWKSKRLL